MSEFLSSGAFVFFLFFFVVVFFLFCFVFICFSIRFSILPSINLSEI